MEKKPVSFLVVSWGKALKRIPQSSFGSRVVEPGSIPIAVPILKSKKRVFAPNKA